MAISYPRALAAPIALARFEPDFQTTHAPEAGGELNAITLGPARWRADYSSPMMRDPELSAWRAWLASMENGVGTFYGVDPIRLLPQSCPAGFSGMTRHGGGAFDGTVSAWTIDGPGRNLELTTLPSTLTVTAGDLVAFVWDTNKRYLTRALETVTAVAGVAEFAVAPRIEAFVPGDAVATLLNPSCVMRIVPGSIEADLRPGPLGQVHFRAVQVLEA